MSWSAGEGSAMHRLFVLLALAAAGLGLWVLLAGPDVDPLQRGTRSLGQAPVAYRGWAVGLLMGLTLAWLTVVEWRDLPVRVGGWVRLQRRRVGLIVLGGLFAGVLLLL
jgi:hypothetical protein